MLIQVVHLSNMNTKSYIKKKTRMAYLNLNFDSTCKLKQQVRQQQPVNGSQHQLQQMQQKNATENGSAATQAPIQTGKEYFCESFAQNLISFEVSFMMYPPWGQMLRIIN